VAGSGGTVDGWRGTLQLLEARPAGGTSAWLRTRDVGVQLLGLSGGPTQLLLQEGRAELFGAALRWDRMAWQAAHGGSPAQIDAKAELEPLALAPLLARAQPDFGWGGDLAVTGRLELRSAPTFAADIVVERSRGDLSVTDETGTQALGLTDLRLGLNVADGVWSFTQGLAGSTVGVAAGAFVARTSPQATWPASDTPVSGVLELQVANLGTWGTWVPAGWRVGGALSVSAGIGGRFGAPEYTGAVHGTRLSVRNFLQGVNVTDGEVDIVLQGATARIERFTARAGAGTLDLGGDASFGASPLVKLQLEAKRFQLLGRVDRRIVVSGNSTLQIERDKLSLGGRLAVDEGLIDFTRSDAPGLSDDVTVTRRPARPADPQTAQAKPAASNARVTAIDMDVRVDLGEQLRVRGRGLDTGLRGELRLTAPGGKLAVNGTVRTAGGTYAAYGQKLEIDRGNLVFNGAAENPRLDIEATRPNLDVRVGVAITGTAVNPRVRLFSEPELSDLDKLSWLVLGRASDGLGRADTALLQRAALALLTGDGEGPTDQLTRAIGLDEVSVRQSDGEVRETVISLGKQLSRRWYVGYERSLNATAGTWQLIYRIAQRFTRNRARTARWT
jgi:translocation and assembly module TamB